MVHAGRVARIAVSCPEWHVMLSRQIVAGSAAEWASFLTPCFSIARNSIKK